MHNLVEFFHRAEAMELEAALKAREGGMNGRLEEGDASGQQLASARRLRSLLSSNRFVYVMSRSLSRSNLIVLRTISPDLVKCHLSIQSRLAYSRVLVSHGDRRIDFVFRYPCVKCLLERCLGDARDHVNTVLCPHGVHERFRADIIWDDP